LGEERWHETKSRERDDGFPGQSKRGFGAGELRNLRILNRYLGGYPERAVRFGSTRWEREAKSFFLLDVGTGAVTSLPGSPIGRNSGVSKLSIVALEPEPVTARVAAILTQKQANPPFTPLLQRGKEGDFRRCGISVVRGDGNAPPFCAGSFDFVLASQLLHHFSEEKIVAQLRTWSRLARRAIIVSDLVRHPIAYYGISLVTKLFTRNIMTLTDAPLSVQRAFTMAEWHELLRRAEIGPFRLFSVFPYRVLALVLPKR
jgi:hypothetical protein